MPGGAVKLPSHVWVWGCGLPHVPGAASTSDQQTRQARLGLSVEVPAECASQGLEKVGKYDFSVTIGGSDRLAMHDHVCTRL